MDNNDTMRKMTWDELAHENAELKAKMDFTYCAYCGHQVRCDDEAATGISEHIKTCTKHPMRAAEATIKKLQDHNAIMACALTQIADVKILAPLGSDPYKCLQTIAQDALRDCNLNHSTEEDEGEE